MCGILGWTMPDRASRSPDLLKSMAGCLAHRGPDGDGFWIGHSRRGEQVALAHRRLSIIDLEGGAQPMWSEDGTVGIVFNGEIYNYVELREVLVAKGHRFGTSSDTEVLIEAYRAYGRDVVRHLRGMFAFALWDTRSDTLLLGRDQFGKKPLFLAEVNGGLLFGSEIAGLLAFPDLPRDLDRGALGEYLLNRYVPGPATFFEAVRKLPPGATALWRDGELSVERYFTPPIATTEPDVGSFEEAVRLFSDTFDESVRIRMRSDAPFGAFLSGGIDSSAVVARMSAHSSGPVRTFSVGFRDEAYSELGHARTIAGLFGTDHRELVVEPDDLLSAWPEAVERRGAPVSEPSDLPILLLSKMARETVKMVLTGEGSDEFLAGYPKHSAEGWVDLYQRVVPGALHDRVIAPAIMRLPFGARRVKVLANAAGERDFADRMRVWFGGVPVEQQARLLGGASDRAPREAFPFSAESSSSLRRMQFFDQTSWLPDNLLERGDRMMMAGSIEGRMPFMDVELASVAARIPDRFHLQHRRGKAVLRAAVARHIPSSILERKKIGFRVPVAEWFRGVHREVVRDLLLSDASMTRSLCSAPAIDQLVDEHVSGRQNHEKALWSLTNLEMFFRAYRPDLALDTQKRAA